MYNMIQENKINKKKGFTLAELLVVVAIIAVLVAISIPIFTAQLEKSREATDIANMRAAKAAAVAQYLGDDTKTGAFVYDAVNGKLVATGTSVTAYGKGTTTKGGCQPYLGYTESTDASGKTITVTVADGSTAGTDAGTVTEAWNK